jgi:hypothetical protein
MTGAGLLADGGLTALRDETVKVTFGDEGTERSTRTSKGDVGEW